MSWTNACPLTRRHETPAAGVRPAAPQLLILDEPTAGLASKERLRLRTMLAEMAADRIILVGTHVVSDVKTVDTEVILLRAGKIVDAALVRDLIDNMAPGQGLEDVYLAIFAERNGK